MGKLWWTACTLVQYVRKNTRESLPHVNENVSGVITLCQQEQSVHSYIEMDIIERLQ